MLQLLRDYLEGLMRFRRRGVSRPWIDLRFREFVADPLSGIELIYEQAGMSLGDETRAAMAAWIEAHPRQDLTRARPADLRPYGIEADAAREIFAEYVEAFGIEYDGV